MKRTLQAVVLTVFAAQTLVIGQGEEVKRVLSQIRAALGGEEKLAAVKTIAVDGHTARPVSDGSTSTQDFELAFDLAPGAVKFMKKDVVAVIGDTMISRRTGFNGNAAIEDMDAPPSMGGGNMRVMRMGPGGAVQDGQATPEQIAAQKAQALVSSHREFARLALGMLGTTTSAYPVEFTYAGQADSANGKADVLEMKSPDGLVAKLYVDGKTHLPLMLAWMDKEPLRVTMNTDGGTVTGSGAVRMFSSNGGGGGQDPSKFQEQMAARMKEAEANRRTVEFRIFYADYKPVDGVRLPTKIERMMDGLPMDEMSLEKIKINGKIDAGKFSVK